jgi:hypothetical protein
MELKDLSMALATAGALLLASSAGAAQTPALPPDAAQVEVVGGPAPKVVASFPADGGVVPAGVLMLKITFDQPMRPDAWSYGHADQGAFPDCLAQPRLLADSRSFVLMCDVAPHKDYAIVINAPADFASDKGRSARSTLLRFSTGDESVFTAHDALAQAGLSDADEPIMRWRDSGKGVSQSPAP